MSRKSGKNQHLFSRFQTEITQLNAEAVLLEETALPERLRGLELLRSGRKAAVLDCRWFRETGVSKILNSLDRPELFWISGSQNSRWKEADLRSLLGDTDIAILPAQNLIAETGTIVLNSRKIPSSELSLLPDKLLVVAPEPSLVADLTAFYGQALPSMGKWGSHLIFISGPSRTSDIEKKLILGMHGPREIFVVVLRSRNFQEGWGTGMSRQKGER